MKSKLLAVVALGLAGLVLAVAAVRSFAEKEPAKKPARYVHTVIFTLTKDAPKDEEAQLIADCHEILGKIPEVEQLRAGRPAEKGTPKLAKKDFNVALTIVFDDYDGL